MGRAYAFDGTAWEAIAGVDGGRAVYGGCDDGINRQSADGQDCECLGEHLWWYCVVGLVLCNWNKNSYVGG